MIWIGKVTRMKFLKIGRQVMYPLSIEVLMIESVSICWHMKILNWTCLSYHITWLKEPKGLHKLRHSPIEVTFLIQIVTISLVNISNSRFTDTLRMGEAQGRGVQVTSIEDFQLGRCRVFVQS